MKKMKGGDKMDSKTLLAVVVTALIVAVLTSLITVKLTGNIIYTPNYVAQNQTAIYTKAEVDSKFANVRANSCNADSICEVNNLTVSSNIITKNLTVSVLGADHINSTSIKLLGDANAEYIFVKKGISAKFLAGSGDGYVCVNRYGDLYRKSTPCI